MTRLGILIIMFSHKKKVRVRVGVGLRFRFRLEFRVRPNPNPYLKRLGVIGANKHHPTTSSLWSLIYIISEAVTCCRQLQRKLP
jgi:hypothetical protein